MTDVAPLMPQAITVPLALTVQGVDDLPGLHKRVLMEKLETFAAALIEKPVRVPFGDSAYVIPLAGLFQTRYRLEGNRVHVNLVLPGPRLLPLADGLSEHALKHPPKGLWRSALFHGLTWLTSRGERLKQADRRAALMCVSQTIVHELRRRQEALQPLLQSLIDEGLPYAPPRPRGPR